jgi:energy-coupling factor transport system substrate-specific component
MLRNTEKVAFLGMFTALGTALGMALAHIPNVELITATVFISGFCLGCREGTLTGIATETLYSLLNPFGMASLPIFLAQTAAMGISGFAGGWFRHLKPASSRKVLVRLGLAGLLLTLNFDILTTVSYGIFVQFSLEKLLASIIIGSGFYIAHSGTNTLIFLTLVPVLLNAITRGIPIFQAHAKGPSK